ncbi:ABC transporter permease subunit [Alcaligenaceae bacterium]|nr:ABC transporter permease subunit [Alcaligenaceae bacterium]
MFATFIDALMQSFGETLAMVAVAGVSGIMTGVPLGMALHLERQHTAAEGRGTLIGLLARLVVQGIRATPAIVVLVVAMTLVRQLPIAPGGLVAMILPLSLLSALFIARRTEVALNTVDHNLVEAARSMGASNWQIALNLLLPERRPELISTAGLALAALVGYSTLVGAIGGSGLGALGMRYGYQEFLPEAMLAIVAILLALAEAAQSTAFLLARRFDRR